MLLLEATEPVASTFPLEIWVPAGASLIVSLVALGGVVLSNCIAGRREERRVQAEREHERERWVRDQKATVYAALTTNLTDQHEHFRSFVTRIWSMSTEAQEAEAALTVLRSEEKRLRASVRMLGAEAVTAALAERSRFVGRSIMDADRSQYCPTVEMRRDWSVGERRLTDATIDAMQRDLGIVLPEERQEEGQGGDDQ